KNLRSDEECPLCGSCHHPNIFSVENVTDEIAKKQLLLDGLQKNKNSIQSLLISLSGAYADYSNFNEQHNQKLQECRNTQNDVKKMMVDFRFTGYTVNDEVLVQTQLAEIQKRTSDIKQLRIDREAILAETEKLQQNVLKYKTAVDEFKNQSALKAGELATLSGQILLHELQDEIRKKQGDLTIGINSLKTEHQQLTIDYENALKILQENSYSLAGLLGRIEELQKQLHDNIQQKIELSKQIEFLLKQEGYAGEKEVEVILAYQLDLKKEKAKIDSFKREIHAATIRLAEARAKIDGKDYNEETHVFLKEEISKLSGEIANKTENLVTERNHLLQLKQQMESKRQLQEELDKLMLRAENLKVLSNLFRASGFVNYVSSVYLQNLINSANHRFYKMTRQKLMLELAEDNAFRVRDFMNNGEVRSVKTLSGGQTFQAALSLALALADNIQHLTKSKQNFFFLDEGFGSLDKDSLAIVFETLKGLRKENRIVGVISHVDEMQQEIPVNLRITNDIERGSLITKSWH
ncbi:MAG TPA: SbcC/MukB-like Walker B domain-containing protein, partial [Segetibacter sp.]|nr:SbcC/MukB-like Walker B domain-containing protein [Segetibacter sp.]